MALTAAELRRQREGIREALRLCASEDSECYSGHVADLAEVETELALLTEPNPNPPPPA